MSSEPLLLPLVNQPAQNSDHPASPVTLASTDSLTANSDKAAILRAKRIANLRPFVKGQSGNPKGRPVKPLSDKLLDKLVRKRHAEASAIAQAIIDKAKTGDVAAFVAIADRVEGKPVQRVEGEQSITITVERIGD